MALAPNPPIYLTDLRTEFGDANGGNVCLTEYYAGGANVAAGTTGTNGPIPSSGTICLTDFPGSSAALFRSTMNADYWTISGPYNTAYNSGYWGLTGQGTFDYLGNNQGYVSFNTAIGSSTSTQHFIFAFRTYVAANGAPCVFIMTLFNTGGYSYTGGQTDITTVNAFTNSNYSSGQILNVATSAAGFSNGVQSINGTNYETATWTWTIGTLSTMSTVFGTNSGYQSGNGTHYIEILK